jgi:hypothetical protein
MISYIIQGITSVLFGPLLDIICLIVGSNPASDSFTDLPRRFWISQVFGPIALSLHRANIIIAVSVLVASLIHLRHACPVAEMEFIDHLAGFQCATAIICTFSYLPIHEASELRTFIYNLYAVGCGIMSLLVSSLARYPSSYAEGLQALMTYCVVHHDWPKSHMDVTQPPIKKEMKSLREKTPTILTGFLSLGIVVGALWCYAPAQNPYVRFCRALHIGPRRFVAIAVSFIVLAGCFLVQMVKLWQLLYARQSLQIASGQFDQPSEWGFGQITAVMMWLPVAVDIIFAIRGKSCRGLILLVL